MATTGIVVGMHQVSCSASDAGKAADYVYPDRMYKPSNHQKDTDLWFDLYRVRQKGYEDRTLLAPLFRSRHNEPAAMLKSSKRGGQTAVSLAEWSRRGIGIFRHIRLL